MQHASISDVFYKGGGLLTSSLRLALVALCIFATGCTVGIRDGMRVTNTNSTISPSGYLTAPGSPTLSVGVEAYNPGTGTWTTIATTNNISTTVNWTLSNGTELYAWNMPAMTIPTQYWQSGTGGSYARIRAFQLSNGSKYNLLHSREDWGECFFEDYDGQGNSLSYLVNNCFSQRTQAYVYTSGYREGPASCPAPSTQQQVHGHYMMQDIPACANNIIYNRMAEHISREVIDNHYLINHGSATQSHIKDTISAQHTRGGFFGGHERYIRDMERTVMVYDYPWAPKGKIPSWNTSYNIPTPFLTAVASPIENCRSTTPGCDGWRSGSVSNNNSVQARPNSLSPANVCNYTTLAAFYSPTNSWHNGVHGALAASNPNPENGFGTFDSPAYPLFFAWHNYVNDIWLDWKACGHPLP